MGDDRLEARATRPADRADVARERLGWGLTLLLTLGALVYGGAVLWNSEPLSSDEPAREAAAEPAGATGGRDEPVTASAPNPVVASPSASPEAAPRLDAPEAAPASSAAPVRGPSSPVHLGGIPWEPDLQRLVRTVTARSDWRGLWGTTSSVAASRLADGHANGVEQLDERPGVSRIEVHRQDKREISRPHLGLEFLDDRLYLVYLYYGPREGRSPRKLAGLLTKGYGAPAASWEEGRRRKCEGWDVGTDVRVSLCKLLSPSTKRIQGLQLSIYEPTAFARVLRDRVRAFDADNAVDGGKYVTSYRAWDDAISRFDAVLSELASYESARAWRAVTLLCARRLADARRDAEYVLSHSRSYVTEAFANWVMARIHVYEGRTDLALTSLETASRLDPWNADYERYAEELRTGELSRMFCLKGAAWVEDERRDGNRDRAEICRRAGIPDPAWLDRCADENRDRDSAWDSEVDDLVDKWRERRGG